MGFEVQGSEDGKGRDLRGATWVENVTLDLSVLSSSPTLGMEPTEKKRKKKKQLRGTTEVDCTGDPCSLHITMI